MNRFGVGRLMRLGVGHSAISNRKMPHMTLGLAQIPSNPCCNFSVKLKMTDRQHYVSIVMVISGWWSSHGNEVLTTLYLLFLGQVVSFGVALSSFFSSLIAKLGVSAPLTQGLFVYLALALIYGGIFLKRRQKLLVSWYWYFLLGFVDVHGSYIFNKALQFTSLTSAAILDCLTIAWVIVLTWIFLGNRYSLWQFVGAAICVLGLGLVLFSDARLGIEGGSRPLLGDILVIVSTIFIATSNVGEEFCVKRKDRVELLSMLGIFGSLVSLCEICIVEVKNLESVKWSAEIILALAGYILTGILLYTLIPFVLKLSGATMFNLSVLTSDMWAVVFRLFLYHQQVDWLYYVAFAAVVFGLLVYNITGNDSVPVPVPASEDGDHEPNMHYQLVTDENGAARNESFTQ